MTVQALLSFLLETERHRKPWILSVTEKMRAINTHRLVSAT